MKKRSRNDSPPYLSVIIPAFKQEKSIVKDVQRIKRVLDTSHYSYELIIVVDGFLDKTYQKIKKIHSKKIKTLGYKENRGKGFAVRLGMLNAKGKVIAFLDAGMDLHPKSLILLLDTMDLYDADIVVGSKLHSLSEVTYPWQRRMLSWGYRYLVRLLFNLKIRDTQVGIKLFKRKVLKKVLPRLLVKQYAFDIEILAVAHALGYEKIVEAPIILKFNKWSSITSKNFWRTIGLMMWDTCAVYYRLRVLKYYTKQ